MLSRGSLGAVFGTDRQDTPSKKTIMHTDAGGADLDDGGNR